MLAIKFARYGKKGKAFYRLVAVEKRRDPFGRIVENLGTYDPRSKKANLKVERIRYRLGCGAQPTKTVHNFLINKRVIKGEKIKLVKTKIGKKKQAAQAAAAKSAKEAAPVAKAESEAKTE